MMLRTEQDYMTQAFSQATLAEHFDLQVQLAP